MKNECTVPLEVVLGILTDLCLDCQAKVRTSLAKSQSIPRAQPVRNKTRLETILETISDVTGISEDRIVNGGNTRDMVRARKQIAIIARQEGFSYAQIGGLLKRHHTTIVHLVTASKA